MPFDAPLNAVRSEYDATITNLSSALRDEINAVVAELKRWGGDNPPPIAGGSYEGLDDYHTYRIELERPLFPPENTGVLLTLGQKRLRGWVEETENDGRAIWVQLEERLKADPRDYVLSFDPTFVLQSTLNELESLHSENSHMGAPAVAKLFGLLPTTVREGESPSAEIVGDLNEDQLRLVRTADASDLVIGFGPPGTGKTRTGAAAIAHLATERNLRVLVTAHTNAALDTMMAAIVDRLPTWAETGKIVRSGRLSRSFQHLGISHKDFRERAYLAHAAEIKRTLDALEAEADLLFPHTRPDIGGRMSIRTLLRGRPGRVDRPRSDSLEARLQTLEMRLLSVAHAPQARNILERLNELRTKIRDEVGHPEKTARIVGATFSKLAVDPTAFNRYDVVVVDEASMATLAQVAIAAARADQKILILGDPRQLPPVVQSRSRNAEEWLKRNVYRQLGLEDPTTTDPRCVLLRTQYRMAPPIRAVVSDTFYAGLLIDAPEIVKRHGTIDLQLVDTSNYGIIEVGPNGDESFVPNRSETSGKSRINPVHADLVGRIVRTLHEEGETDIAIITPFNAQTRLVRDALRFHDVAGDFWNAGGTVSTIHRAQGGERDVVILDFVDAPGDNGDTRAMSSFLDARWNSDLPNLINVAISRARRRLIVIAHARGFRQRYGRGSLIFDLLARIYNEGTYVRMNPTRLESESQGRAPGSLNNPGHRRSPVVRR